MPRATAQRRDRRSSPPPADPPPHSPAAGPARRRHRTTETAAAPASTSADPAPGTSRTLANRSTRRSNTQPTRTAAVPPPTSSRGASRRRDGRVPQSPPSSPEDQEPGSPRWNTHKFLLDVTDADRAIALKLRLLHVWNSYAASDPTKLFNYCTLWCDAMGTLIHGEAPITLARGIRRAEFGVGWKGGLEEHTMILNSLKLVGEVTSAAKLLQNLGFLCFVFSW